MSRTIDAYVATIHILHTYVKNCGLTLQSGGDIVKDVRDGYVANRCPRYIIYEALEFELDTLVINDGHKECGKKKCGLKTGEAALRRKCRDLNRSQ